MPCYCSEQINTRVLICITPLTSTVRAPQWLSLHPSPRTSRRRKLATARRSRDFRTFLVPPSFPRDFPRTSELLPTKYTAQAEQISAYAPLNPPLLTVIITRLRKTLWRPRLPHKTTISPRYEIEITNNASNSERGGEKALPAAGRPLLTAICTNHAVRESPRLISPALAREWTPHESRARAEALI